MAKLTLVASPTFTAPTRIPVPGAEPAEVEFTYKHRTRDQLKQLIDEAKGMKDPELIEAIASGWDLAEPFNRANIETLLQNYYAAGRAAWHTYLDEITGQRQGN